jgi:N-acetylglucosamine kinase-like BadF-type ATPase
MYLGVDGGGTKTAYALVDAGGKLCAVHQTGTVSHLAAGFGPAAERLLQGVRDTLHEAGIESRRVTFAYFGLPAYGEDSSTTARMDAMPAPLFATSRYRCGNDMICSWAGSLACADGISVIAGTGSMAYGEYAGRTARAGGWGELIGDEGSAYWIAREGMNLFSRMSDGRAVRGPLYELVRRRMGIAADLDLCARIYGESADTRQAFAQFARLVDEAANSGDEQSRAIFVHAARELATTVAATRRSLGVPDDLALPVSYSGGVFNGSPLLVDAFRDALAAADGVYDLRTPVFAPEIGAALYAARLAGTALPPESLARLRQQCAASIDGGPSP